MLERLGLDEPLRAAQAVQLLLNSISKNGELDVGYLDGCDAIAELQLHPDRGDYVTPLFDPEVSYLSDGRVFWLYARRRDGELVAKQAFRMELVTTNLAEWALGWILGIYLKRGELIVPTRLQPNKNSVSHSLSGTLVYHGELWISPSVKRRDFVELFSKLGLVLAHIKWNPDAIWALVGKGMATRGHMSRMGYPCLEPGFLDWEFVPEGADKLEWLGVADHRALSVLIEQLTSQTTLMSTGQTSEMTVTPC